MRYMRHECGHAINYAFKLYERPEWRSMFGPFSPPVSRTLSRRSILARVRSTHPRLVRAETSRRGFRRDVRGVADAGVRLAVGSTPDWPALAKLEYVDRVMSEIRDADWPDRRRRCVTTCRSRRCTTPSPNTTRRSTTARRSKTSGSSTRTFAESSSARSTRPQGSRHSGSSNGTIAKSCRESRIGRARARASCGSLIDHLARRAAELDLRVGGLEAATLIELTAFGTAVVMNHRYTQHARSNVERYARSPRRGMKIVVLHTADALEPPVDPLLDQLRDALRALEHDVERVVVDCEVEQLVAALRNARTGPRVQPRRVVRRKERARIERRGAAQSARPPLHRLESRRPAARRATRV